MLLFKFMYNQLFIINMHLLLIMNQDNQIYKHLMTHVFL